ncbi:TonB-dependent receptor [Caenibius tardaugens NBRC 16725]|nr:TonB-dependent receptor [Caenibius tardaugens NBRC 16725]
MKAVFLYSAAITLPVAAHAQDQGKQADLNEIIVTAQKRSQSIHDVGIAITSLSGEELQKSKATDVSAVAAQIPGVVATTSSNLPAFTMRGIGMNDFASNFDAPIALYVDEVYRSKPYMASVPFFDIDHVEALKGPQGTTFGRNSTGGSVNFYTNAPTFTNEGAINAQIDNYGRARVDGFVNIKLSSELALRGSYYIAQGSGGPYRNLYTGKRFGGPNQFAGRIQALWEHNNTTIRLVGYGFRDKSELTPYKAPGIYNADGSLCPQLFNNAILQHADACLKFPVNPGPGTEGQREPNGKRNFAADFPWKANNRALGGYLRIEQEAGPLTITSLTSYDTFRRDQNEDSDASIFVSANTLLYSNIHQFSQELRATGQFGPLRVLVGGYYEHDSIRSAESANLAQNTIVLLPPFAPRLASAFRQKVRSLAIYTNNELELTDKLSFIFGLRYTSDRISVDGATFLGADDPTGASHTITPVIPVDAIDGKRTDGTTSFRGQINFKATPDHLFYASVSRGFRSGGYSVPFGGAISTFAPEQLTAYEVGSKSRFLDRTIDLNLAAFYYDYRDIQATVNDPASPLVAVTRNIGKSRTYGFEGDLTWRPDPSLTLRLGATYLDAKYNKTDATIQTYNGLIPLKGKRPINTPKWSFQGYLQKSFPISDSLELTGSTDVRFVGDRFLSVTNQTFDAAPSYWVQNARLAIGDPDGSWEIALWGKNIWNKTYLTYLNNVSFFRIQIYGEPASYGLSGTIKF